MRVNKATIHVVAAAAAVAAGSIAQAATLFFNPDAGNTALSTTASFTASGSYTTDATGATATAVVPTAADVVVISNGDVAEVSTTANVGGGSGTGDTIRIANGGGVNRGTLSVVNGGNLTVGLAALGGNLSVGRSGTAGSEAYYVQTGGTTSTVVTSGTATTANNGFQNGEFKVSDSAGSVGRANISGGTLNIGDDLNVGEGGAGTTGTNYGEGANVNVINQSGGTVNIASRALVGSGAGSLAVYNLSAGTLNLTGTLGAGNAANGGGTNARDALIVANNGTATFNQTGGTVSLANGLFIANQTGSTGTYSFSGGTLTNTRGINVAAATNAGGIAGNGTGTFRVVGNAAGSSITAGGIFASTSGATLGFNIGDAGGTTLIQLTGSSNLTASAFDLDVLAGSGYIPNGTTVYTLASSTSGTLTGFDAARPVSADGDAFDGYFIVASAQNSGGYVIQAVPANLVPEPGTLSALGLGAVLLRRRRA